MDTIYAKQRWSGTLALLDGGLPAGSDEATFCQMNKGPWCELDRDLFVPPELYPGIPDEPPPGGTLYPADLTKAEFDGWCEALPEGSAERKAAEGFFHVIRRKPGGVAGDGQLTAVAYADEYKAELTKAAALLEEAATLTAQPALRSYLTARAAAFASNEYADSDALWLTLDSDIHVTIGPCRPPRIERAAWAANPNAPL